MPTPNPVNGPAKRPSNLIVNYPGGFAWAAFDDRRGLYVTCPNEADAPMGLATHDDFGFLVSVPSLEVFSGGLVVPA